jgi:TrmH family RNA methyltransferase
MVGTTTLITSRTNRLVKLARTLRRRKARAESGLFLVEGIHPVGEVIEAGWDIEAIIYAPEKLESDFANQLVSRFEGRIERVSQQVLESLAGKENPQGILAIVHQRPPTLEKLPACRCGAALVAPQDPGNLGSVARILDAVGADMLLLLDGGVDAYHPTAIRASMGALFWITVAEATFDAFNRWRLDRHLQLVGTSAAGSQDYRSFRPGPAWILLLGSEQKGLTAAQMSACDASISLPMRGRASSLNLAVAAGILLYSLA